MYFDYINLLITAALWDGHNYYYPHFFLAKDTESKKGNELAQVTCQVMGELQAQKVWIQNLRYYPQTPVQ